MINIIRGMHPEGTHMFSKGSFLFYHTMVCLRIDFSFNFLTYFFMKSFLELQFFLVITIL